MPRTRAAPVLALTTLVVAGMCAMATSSSQAAVRTRASFDLSSQQPVAREWFTASGRVSTRFRRPVQVRVLAGPSWRVVRRATTSTSGVYRVTRLATTVPRRYSVVVPAVRRSGRVFSRVVTGTRTVSPVQQSSSLDVLPPVAQRGSAAAASSLAKNSVVARFTPARPGRPVTFRERSQDGRWVVIGGSTRQGADGTAYFFGTAGTRVFEATTASRFGAPAVTTRATSNAWVPTFGDDFSGTTLDRAKWSYRTGRAPSRTPSTNDPRSVTVGSGTLRLQVRLDPAAPNTTAANTRYLNGQVGTDGGYDFTYGVASARVRFSPARGQHGSFWLQSPTYGRFAGNPGSSGTEIDVAEFFGRGFPKGGLATYVYYTDRTGDTVKIGDVWPRAAGLVPRADTWWSSYHVFTVKWGPRGYTFYVDGRVLYATDRGVSQTRQYLILSLLTSDWELPDLRRASLPTSMSVDWARVWRSAVGSSPR